MKFTRNKQLNNLSYLICAVIGASAIFSSTAHAEKCSAEAEFKRASPVHEGNAYNFKFRTTSDDCNKYGCTGYISFRIHYAFDDSNQVSKDTVSAYRIKAGQKSVETTDMVVLGISHANVEDVDVKEVSCSTP